MESQTLFDTIVSFKEATEQGFLRMDRRFDGLERRVTSVEGRLTSATRY